MLNDIGVVSNLEVGALVEIAPFLETLVGSCTRRHSKTAKVGGHTMWRHSMTYLFGG